MKLIKTIKKAEKLSGAKAIQNGLFFNVIYKNHIISFAGNGRIEENPESTNFYTKKIGTKADDSMTDYFGGTFHNNLTQAFKFIDVCAR